MTMWVRDRAERDALEIELGRSVYLMLRMRSSIALGRTRHDAALVQAIADRVTDRTGSEKELRLLR